MNIVFRDILSVSLLNYLLLFMYFLSRHFSFNSVFIFMFKTKTDIGFKVRFCDWNKEKQDFLFIVIVLLIYFSFKMMIWHLIFVLPPQKFHTSQKVFFSTYQFLPPDICKILHFNLSFPPWLIFQGVISSLQIRVVIFISINCSACAWTYCALTNLCVGSSRQQASPKLNYMHISQPQRGAITN